MKTFSKFLLVGLLNTGWGYFLIFSFMYLFKLSPEVSNMAGYAIAILTSYGLNRRFTFSSKNKKFREIRMFITVFIIAYALNFITLYAMINYYKNSDFISQIVAGIVYVAVSYFMNRKYVFHYSDLKEKHQAAL